MLTFIDKHDPITVKAVDKDFVAAHDGRRLEIKKQGNDWIVVWGYGNLSLGEVPLGATIWIDRHKWTVLSHGRDTTALTTEGLVYMAKVQRGYCACPIGWMLEDVPVIEHTVKLVALDGTRPKKNQHLKCSMMTLEQYQRYRQYLHTEGERWLLATPKSWRNAYAQCCVAENTGFIKTVDEGENIKTRPFIVVDSTFTNFNR